MPGRIYLANVGANASHRFAGPVFDDGAFEFLPIPEDRQLPAGVGVRYSDLQSHNESGRDLQPYVPPRLWDGTTHNDPEFETFTYGDNCGTSPRAASLKRVEPGDLLLFLARLERWTDGKATGAFGFYLVAYLEIEQVFRDVRSPPDDATLARIRNNAHVRRGFSDPVLWDGFWVFTGSARSRRFPRAVPVTRELAEMAFTTATGSPWRWSPTRTDLQVIGSYTRSCRCIIDPAIPGHQRRARALWEWTARYGAPGPASKA